MRHLTGTHDRHVHLGDPVEAARVVAHLDADWLLTLSYETLNRARRRRSPNLHFVGAPLPKSADVDVELPPGDAPLVLVGFSTTPITTAADLQTVVDALAGMNVRALVTLGRVEPGELDLPPNVAETRFAPHDQVLPHADLMVSHVGHGSLCAAARHGIPILALPWGRDQHVNAETLTDIGLGFSLPSGSTAEEIADAAGRLLADDAIRRTCSDVAPEIATHAGLDEAVRLISEAST